MTKVAAQLSAVAAGDKASCPIARLLRTISINAAISGAASTPFTTAAQ